MATITAMNRKDDVIGVISKEPELRREFEVNAILPWLRKKSQLLQTLEKSVLLDVIKNCEYKQSYKDEVVIKQGDKGDCFYIILEGSVSIHIDAKLSGEDEIAVAPEDDDDGTKDVATAVKSTEKDSKSLGKGKSLDRSRYGRYIIKFGAGKSFGEIALISDDCVRNATIIVDERSEFLVIHKDLFDRCLKVFQEKEYAAVQSFVNNHDFFRRWHPRLKRLLEMSLRKETYVYDSVILRQGDPVTGLNFIKQGQAVMTVQPSKHRKQYARLWPFEAVTDLYASEFEWLRESRKNAILKKYRDPSALPTRVEPVAVKRSLGYVAAEQLARDKSITVCNIHDNEVMGDIESILNLGTYMQTVTCSSNTDIFILDHKNFDRLIVKRNPRTLKVMRDHVQEKLHSRMKSKHGNQIPLFGYLHYKMDEITRPQMKKLPPLLSTKSLPGAEILQQHMLEKFIAGKAQLIEPLVQGSLYYRDVMQEKARIRESIRQNIASKTKQKKMLVKSNRKPRSLLALRNALEDMIHEDMVAWRESSSEHARRQSRQSVMSVRKKSVQDGVTNFERQTSIRSGTVNSLRDEALEANSAQCLDSDMTETAITNYDENVSLKSAAKAWFQGSVPSYLRGFQDSPEDLDLGLTLRTGFGSPKHIVSQHIVISPSLSNSSDKRVFSPDKVLESDVSKNNKNNLSENGAFLDNQTKYTDTEKLEKINGFDTKKSVLFLPPIIEEAPHMKLNDEEPANIVQSPRKSKLKNKLPDIKSKIHHSSSTTSPRAKDNILNFMSNTSPIRTNDDLIDTNHVDEIRKNTNSKSTKPDSSNKMVSDSSDLNATHATGNEHGIISLVTNDDKIGCNGSYISTAVGDKSRTRWRDAAENIIKQGIRENINRRPVFDRIQTKSVELESGDSSLSLLESRLKAFHVKMGNVSNRKSGKLPKLRRYRGAQVDGRNKLHPGGKVCVQRRVCELNKCKYHIKNHQHVRYHMTGTVPSEDNMQKS